LVALQNGNRELKLNIRDNGKGFVWPLPDDVQHHGLKNMQRRAHQMKGTFAIDTAPNEGTHLNLKVKLPDFL
jgi:signal transduction histidine kinase